VWRRHGALIRVGMIGLLLALAAVALWFSPTAQPPCRISTVNHACQ
jgi:hypothetical protein